MNDPHVVSLTYHIVHRSDVSYSGAHPVSYDGDDFSVRIEDNEATVALKTHSASERQARAAVEPFLELWEIKTALNWNVGEFKFRFVDAEVIDRNPAPPPEESPSGFGGGVTVTPPPGTLRISGVDPTVICGRDYTQPPDGMALTPDVRSMYQRYCGFVEGREPLAAMAYFCLSLLESSASAKKDGSRDAAVKLYRINRQVLDKLGELVSEKGGPEARKRTPGKNSPEYSSTERAWIEKTVKTMIRRMAEIAAIPEGRRTINLTDLPPL